MALRKCNPITVKPLTVRGSQKHLSTLTNFLSEEHSINNQIHFPRDRQFSYDQHQQDFGWVGGGNKTTLKLLDKHDQSLFPKGCSSTTLYIDLAHVGYFLFFYFSVSYLVLLYLYCTYLYVPAKDLSKCPSLDISKVPCALPSLSGCQYPEVYPYIYHLTPDTTEPIGSSWYLSRISSQVLTHISFILYY